MGAQDEAAEVPALKVRFLERKNVIIEGAKCAVGPMLHPLIERLDDLMPEVVATWIGGNHRLALFIRKVVIAAAHYIHSRPACTKAISGCMCSGTPGVVWRAMAVQTLSISLSEKIGRASCRERGLQDE